MSTDLAHGIEEHARLINWYVGVWHDLGYETPPTRDCKAIPPLGERSAEAIKGAHAAIAAIDVLTRQLFALRAQLVGELRQNEDILMARLEAKYGPIPTRPKVTDEQAAKALIGMAEALRDLARQQKDSRP